MPSSPRRNEYATPMLGKEMEKEIREQPEVLARNASKYEAQLQPLKSREFDMVLLAARGSSDNAAFYARYLIEIHLGIPVSLAAPSVITRYKANVQYPNCLAIGISQSGAAPDVDEVLTHLKKQGHTTLAITNTQNSRIANSAEHTLYLDAGKENSVAATKTYTSTLLALYQTVRALGGNLPSPEDILPTEAWLEHCRKAAEEPIQQMLKSRPIFALARGYDFATTYETALKLMECALIPCKGYSSADFEHGPKALAGKHSMAFVFGTDASYLKSQGCTLIDAPKPPDNIPEELHPIWHIMFSQWLALLSARAKDLDPDNAIHLSKVTKTL